ncbi:hypothetical protein [Nonomuraea sp. NPDC049400]|uniref:hypothetical protein n=1 Tax=Nonomuraea sp. NPDC049400 TaxID=3364352 RepID=UPI00379F3141
MLGHVGADQPEAVVGHEMLDVGDRSGEEVVDAENAVALGQKSLTKMRTEKTGAAGNGHDRPSYKGFSLSFPHFMAAKKGMLRPRVTSFERALVRSLRKIGFDPREDYDGRVATVNPVLLPYSDNISRHAAITHASRL